MKKKCKNCKYYDDYYIGCTHTDAIQLNEMAKKLNSEDVEEERPKWCPLIEK